MSNIKGKFYLKDLNAGLSISAIKIYIYLSSYGDGKQIYPSQTTIQKSVGLTKGSQSRCSTCIDELVNTGLIKKQIRKNRDGTNTSNIYNVISKPETEKYGLVDIDILPLITKVNDLKLYIYLSKLSGFTFDLDKCKAETGLSTRAIADSKRSLMSRGLMMYSTTHQPYIIDINNYKYGEMRKRA